MVEYRSDMILWILKENYSGCWETNKPWCGKIKRRLVKKKKGRLVWWLLWLCRWEEMLACTLVVMEGMVRSGCNLYVLWRCRLAVVADRLDVRYEGKKMQRWLHVLWLEQLDKWWYHFLRWRLVQRKELGFGHVEFEMSNRFQNGGAE